MPGHAVRALTCHVCNKRKARYKDGCCDPCHFLILAEGTQDQYGIATESETMTAYREYAKRYNKLARQGMRQPEIAEAMGYTLAKIRNLVYRMRASGVKVAKLDKGFGSADGKIEVIAKSVAPRNDHGGGKWGVTGCKCDPCKAVVAVARQEVDARRERNQSKKIARLEARIVELEAMLAVAKGLKKASKKDSSTSLRSSEEEHAALNGGVGIS